MHWLRWVAGCAAAVLAGCGGGGDPMPVAAPGDGTAAPQEQVAGAPAAPLRFRSLVSFGDSLSDVGTYAVGAIKALGGGKYTVNGPNAHNWIELMAARLALPPPCPAQTGLHGDPAQGFFVPVMNFPGCTAYAQGGARVTDPTGPSTKLLPDKSALVGQLTVPVVAQIQNHLAISGGRFNGDEIVFVMAGGNDVFAQLIKVASGGDPFDAIPDMGTAGAELAGYVKDLIIGKGARQVVVVNLPDLAKSPAVRSQLPLMRDYINSMVVQFNTLLQQGLAGTDVLYVDAYAASRDYIDNPVKYGLTNTTDTACDLSPEKNPLGSSLICTGANVIPGVIDRYLFADGVHPTPYGYQLLADTVSVALESKGWLSPPPGLLQTAAAH